MSVRSRDGCWTCRRRKKKCDGRRPKCATCERLSFQCEGYGVRLMFEDAPERAGIRKRGPRSREAVASEKAGAMNGLVPGLQSFYNSTVSKLDLRKPSPSPKSLALLPDESTADTFLWDCYVNRFCKTYPTFSDASNPFLTILIPLALKYESVKHAILAIAGLQISGDRPSGFRTAALRHRGIAMNFCKAWWEDIVTGEIEGDSRYNPSSVSMVSTKSQLGSEDKLSLATTSILSLLIAKLSGENYEVIQPFFHIVDQFLTEEFLQIDQNSSATDFGKLHFNFLSRLYNYNRLLASLACNDFITLKFDDKTFNEHFELEQAPKMLEQHLNFPSLLARISAASEYMSTLDLDRWVGDLHFLPSFSSTSTETLEPHGWAFFSDSVTNNMEGIDEHAVIREVYRLTARIYLFQQLRDKPNLPNTLMTLSYPPFVAQEEIDRLCSFEIDLLKLLPPRSTVDTALLLPLGVAAPELTALEERKFVIDKLRSLQNRLGFEHFGILGKDLLSVWTKKDQERKKKHMMQVGNVDVESLASMFAPIRLWG